MKKIIAPWLFAAFIIVALIGLSDASYLTYEHYVNPFGGCTLGGCLEVTTSEYSEIFGVPLALLGMLYYGSILLGLGLVWVVRSKPLMKLVALFTVSGLMASAYFVYLQIAVIKAICPYCMLSAGTSTVLFALGMTYLKNSKVGEEETE